MAVRDVIQAAAGIGGAAPLYVEDVFSTTLYTGTSSARAVTTTTPLGSCAAHFRAEVTGTNSTYSSAFDSSGNFYTSVTSTNVTQVTKYSATGAQQWQQKFYQLNENTTAKTIYVSDADNLYITGRMRVSGNNAFGVIRLSTADGSIVWQKGLNATNSNYSPEEIIEKGDYVYLCGQAYDGSTVSPFVSKLAVTNGASSWSLALNAGVVGTSRGLFIDDTDVYITGTYGGTNRAFLAKVEISSGTMSWFKGHGYSGSYPSTGFSVTSDGTYLYVVGQDYFGGNYYRPRISKFDKTGSLLSSKTFELGGGGQTQSPVSIKYSATLGKLVALFNGGLETGADYHYTLVTATTSLALENIKGFPINNTSNYREFFNKTSTGWKLDFKTSATKYTSVTLPEDYSTFGSVSYCSLYPITYSVLATTTYSTSAGGTSGLNSWMTTAVTIDNAQVVDATTSIANVDEVISDGCMLWLKCRTILNDHSLFDSVRGTSYALHTNSTLSQENFSKAVSSFNSDGFGLATEGYAINNSGAYYSSWSFRKAEKFFDVVTWSGDGASSKVINHNLGSTPGCILVKSTNLSDTWKVYHRSLGSTNALILNTDGAASSSTSYWFNTDPTDSQFTVGSAGNQSSYNYVAYIFSHDAGGFGEDGNQSIISCGSFVGASTIELGWEPQFVLYKAYDASPSNWVIADSMRGISNAASGDYRLNANDNSLEGAGGGIDLSATGFSFSGSTASHVYIAIRRGPMKPPTSGTEVFQPVAYTSTNVDNRLVETGIVTDMVMARARTVSSSLGFVVGDRLRGDYFLGTAVTNAEATDADSFDQVPTGYGNAFSMQNGFGVGNDLTRLLNYSTNTEIAYAFKRAPGFFDEVCYTGGGPTPQSVPHNLGVVPEMMIVKSRSAAYNWPTYHSGIGNNAWILLNSIDSISSPTTLWNATSPTASVFTVGNNINTNETGTTYVAYLFASCPGVSKVGSYTGNGTSKTIDCGFSTGARFIMIKNALRSANWLVFDTARGITAGSADPYLYPNLSDAESTVTDYIDPHTSGFTVKSSSFNVNFNGDTYIYLAIA